LNHDVSAIKGSPAYSRGLPDSTSEMAMKIIEREEDGIRVDLYDDADILADPHLSRAEAALLTICTIAAGAVLVTVGALAALVWL
jgi:hypothetical protein